MVSKAKDSPNIRAFIVILKLGRKIQDEYPQVADMYRKGMSLEEIANELSIGTHEAIAEESISHSAIYRALKGYNGEILGLNYEGLMDGEELRSLGKFRRRENGLKAAFEGKGIHSYTTDELKKISALGGATLCLKRKGIHALSSEEKSRCGQIGGKKAYSQGKGVHALTPDQRMANSSKAGSLAYERKLGAHAMTDEQKKAIRDARKISKGKDPWVPRLETENYTQFSEREYLARMIGTTNFSWQNERYKGKLNNILAALELNKTYHEGKEVRSVKDIVSSSNNIRRLQRKYPENYMRYLI